MNRLWPLVLFAASAGCSDDASPADTDSSNMGGAAPVDAGGTAGAGGAMHDATDEDGPFQLTRQLPEPGETDFWLRHPIEATFSQPLQADTVSGATVRVLVDGAELETTVDLVEGGKTIRVLLETIPEAPAELTVELSEEIRSESGEAVEAASWSVSAPEWVRLDTLGRFTDTRKYRSEVAVDSAGGVVAAWREDDHDFKQLTHAYASRWTPDGWEELGTWVSDHGEAARFSVALDAEDRPLLAILDRDPDHGETQLFTKRWTGDGWEPVGGPVGSDFQYIDLALDSNGYPVVSASVWQGSGTTARGSLRRWTGSAWTDSVEFRGSPASIITDDISHVVDGDDRPVAAFTDDDGPVGPDGVDGPQVHVRRWNEQDSEWVSFGSGPNSGADPSPVSSASVAVDSNNRPWVAYVSDGMLVVEHWTGTEWERLAEVPDEDEGIGPNFPKLVLDSADRPVVSWHEERARLRRWTGESWSPLSNISLEPASLDDFALDPYDAPVVTWIDSEEGSIEVRRLNR